MSRTLASWLVAQACWAAARPLAALIPCPYSSTCVLLCTMIHVQE